MNSKLRIIVSGLIAQYPLGGVTWDYFQYVLGLAQLGHDVYYLEDTGQWPYNPDEGGTSKGGEFNARYLGELMARFDLEDRWAYRFPWQNQWYGMSENKRRDIVETADLLINVSGVLQQPWRYRGRGRLAYIDSDPVFTQVKLAKGQSDFEKIVDVHDIHFSFGESLSSGPLPHVPDTAYEWLPTRQPIVLEQWMVPLAKEVVARRNAFTTIMNWTSYKPLQYSGQSYGQKDIEFRRIIDLPKRIPNTTLEIAINEGKTRRTPRHLLAHEGWQVVDPAVVCPDLDTYRHYIQTSKAEFSVAKQGYVVGQSGWFSCRSACYLAAGRPVIVQETGFSSVLPTGQGLLAFTSLQEAMESIEQVEHGYKQHSQAAREIAETYFDATNVLNDLIEKAVA